MASNETVAAHNPSFGTEVTRAQIGMARVQPERSEATRRWQLKVAPRSKSAIAFEDLPGTPPEPLPGRARYGGSILEHRCAVKLDLQAGDPINGVAGAKPPHVPRRAK